MRIPGYGGPGLRSIVKSWQRESQLTAGHEPTTLAFANVLGVHLVLLSATL